MTARDTALRPTPSSASRTTVPTHGTTHSSNGERSPSSTQTTTTRTSTGEHTEIVGTEGDSDPDKQGDESTCTRKRTPGYDAMNRAVRGASALLDGATAQVLCKHKLMDAVVKYIAVPLINKHLDEKLHEFGIEFVGAHHVYLDVVNRRFYVEGDTPQQRFASGLTQAWGRAITVDHADSLLKVVASCYDRAVTWWLDTNSQRIADLDEAVGAFFGSEELEARLRRRMTTTTE